LAALPEAAYVRGFVRSYARILNLDPTPLVADLATKFGPATASVVDGMARQRDYSPVREAAREQASRRFVVLGAVLLLVALGALGWYATRGGSSPVSTVPASPQAAAPAAIPAALPPAATETAAPSSSAVPDMAPAAGDAPVIMEPVPVPPLLKIRFTGSSWAEVKDAEGKVLHSQHNNAGAEHVVEGTPPFYVVIGDAGKAVVEVRGEPYDMAPHTRQNVARFTID